MRTRGTVKHSLTLCLSIGTTVFGLSACSKQPTSVVSQPTQTPEPKMEGQSANWKVTVTSIRKVPKQAPEYNPTGSYEVKLPENKYDTLEVNVVIEYMGPASDVQSPVASLLSDTGQKFEAVKAAFHPAPDDILQMKNVPSEKIIEVMESAEYKKRQKEVEEILSWIDADSKTYKKNPRTVKTGEKFDLAYSFKDPKEYSNLKLSFEDVPPIVLKTPLEYKEGGKK